MTPSAIEGSSVRRVRGVDRVGLQEGVTLPVVRQKNAPQIRMAGEPDPEHVVRLAFHPVGAAENRRDRRALGHAGAELRLHHQPDTVVEVVEPYDQLESYVLPVNGGEEREETAPQVLF